MRVICRHGHFAFYPRDEKDISLFASYNELELVRVGDYFTFESISEAPDFSLEGLAYLNLTASETYEGNPWEIFRENNFVYDLANDEIKLKTQVSNSVKLPQTGPFYCPPVFLIQPGSILADGNRVMSYDAEFDQESYQLKVREFAYV